MSDYADSVATLGKEHPQLADEMDGFGTLESVLRWMDRRGISLDRIDIVFQDEYSHDFSIPLENDGRYLVFGIT